MEKLSPDAIRILRKINQQGMIVLSSYRVKHPYYGHEYEEDTERMPDEDWAICEEELWHYESKTHYHQPRVKSNRIHRTLVQGDSVIKTIHEIMGEDEILINSEELFNYEGYNDGLFKEERKIEYYPTRPPSKYKEFQSDYLKIEGIEMDDYFEERIGLLERYVLTDEALHLIGVGVDN
ncbi:hypothetical protein C8B47_10750 [filamentous cyanobacterium CCP4]|nr:hypothetical protein C8B47_10750 [filamentous cyanobacterium CCP4]